MAQVGLANMKINLNLNLNSNINTTICTARLLHGQGQPTQGFLLLQSALLDPNLSSYHRVMVHIALLDLFRLNELFIEMREWIPPTLDLITSNHHLKFLNRVQLYDLDGQISISSDPIPLTKLMNLDATKLSGQWYWYSYFLRTLYDYNQLFHHTTSTTNNSTKPNLIASFQKILNGLNHLGCQLGIEDRITKCLDRLQSNPNL